MVTLQRLRQYLQEEHLAKKGTELDLDEWEDYFHEVRRRARASRR